MNWTTVDAEHRVQVQRRRLLDLGPALVRESGRTGLPLEVREGGRLVAEVRVDSDGRPTALLVAL